MWKRFTDVLRCPCCQGKLELISLEERKAELQPEDYAKGDLLSIDNRVLNDFVDSGILLSKDCGYWYPILYGLPVLLPYETPITHEFVEKYRNNINKLKPVYKLPQNMPIPGEQFVLRSFSKEWIEYNYDDVIWGWSYKDREETLLIEMGFEREEIASANFLEIGCGLGITTDFAQTNFQGDAIGIDLSLAVLKATKHFRNNPFLHFVQASLFNLPLRKNYFEFLYSHGVLHHTYSTEEAFKAIAPYCKSGGKTYIWVYGIGSQTNTWDRKLGHYAEVFIRPLLSRAPAAIATAFLTPIALGYIILNKIFRLKNPAIQPYNFGRALHAARDRFTPRFAYRQDYEEVENWFKEAGYDNIERVDWRMIPAAAKELFRHNTGVRGRKKISKDETENP